MGDRVNIIGLLPYCLPTYQIWNGSYTTPDYNNPDDHQPPPDWRVGAYQDDGNGGPVCGEGTDYSIAVDQNEMMRIFWLINGNSYQVDIAIHYPYDCRPSYPDAPVEDPCPDFVSNFSDTLSDGDELGNNEGGPLSVFYSSGGAVNTESDLVCYGYNDNGNYQVDFEFQIRGADNRDQYPHDHLDYSYEVNGTLDKYGFCQDPSGQIWWSGFTLGPCDSDFYNIDGIYTNQPQIYQSLGNFSDQDNDCGYYEDDGSYVYIPCEDSYSMCSISECDFDLEIFGHKKQCYQLTSTYRNERGLGKCLSGSLKITEDKYWPYQDTQGNPVYDDSTGDQLTDPFG